MRRNYAEYVARKRREHGDKFTEADLEPRFVLHFEAGDRIEVQDAVTGYLRRGVVSVTTGWRPTFLLIHRRSDHGSSDVLGVDDFITRIVRKGD